jgi:hypothetical protein
MNNTIMPTNYIYLLQEREFIKTNENIYKVGRTKKENHERFNQYPKGSVLLFQMICNDCENIEKMLIKKFKERFNQRKDIGNEYFEGDYEIMIDIIYSTIKNEMCITSSVYKFTNLLYKTFHDESCFSLKNAEQIYSFFGKKTAVYEADMNEYEFDDARRECLKSSVGSVHFIRIFIRKYTLNKCLDSCEFIGHLDRLSATEKKLSLLPDNPES